MKKRFFLSIIAGLFAISLSFGQDIPQSQVPSLIVNSFQQDYPNAKDIEWEMKGEAYEVEFELGWPSKDHEIRYDATGKILLHKEEISKKDLPAKVAEVLNTEYKSYRIKDIEKIVEGERTVYTLEAKSISEEWDLVIDPEGNILSKIPD